MVRGRRVTPHESERRARAMLRRGLSACSDAPERSDDCAALRAALPCRIHASPPAPASPVRMEAPFSSRRVAR